MNTINEFNIATCLKFNNRTVTYYRSKTQIMEEFTFDRREK